MFDALLHARALGPRDLADLRFFGVTGGLVPSDDAVPASTAAAVRRGWEEVVLAVRRLRRAGLAAWGAIGVHPRRVPLRGLEALLADLPAALGRPGIAAVGAVGLDAGGELEERVLVRQLELARELRLPVLVSTPWRGKERVTRRVLAILREAELEPSRVLVAGADARMVRAIRACGHLAGLSLSGDGLERAVAARLDPRARGARPRDGRRARGRRPARPRPGGGPADAGRAVGGGRPAGLRRERPRVPGSRRGGAPRPAPAALTRAVPPGLDVAAIAQGRFAGARRARRAAPVARAAPGLLEELHGLDPHAPLVPLQHVVDGEAARGDGGEGLHLDAGPVDGPDRRDELDPAAPGRRLDLHAREGDGVAERDEVRRPLRGHDAGEARGGEHVALLHVAAADPGEGGGRHGDEAPGDGDPLGPGLLADVDHSHGVSPRSRWRARRGTAPRRWRPGSRSPRR